MSSDQGVTLQQIQSQMNKLNNQLEELNRHLQQIAALFDIASNTKELKAAAGRVEDEIKRVGGLLKIVKAPQLLATISLIVVIGGFISYIVWIAVPGLETKPEDLALWHNLALLIVPTVAFGLVVWGIVKVCSPE